MCVLLLAELMHSKGYGFTFFNSHLKAYQMVAGQTTQAFSAESTTYMQQNTNRLKV